MTETNSFILKINSAGKDTLNSIDLFPKNKEKITVYLSGKITGLVHEEATLKFALAEQEVTKKFAVDYDNVEIINPMKIGKELEARMQIVEPKKYLTNCINHLIDADVVYMLKNWVKSPGAKIEHDIAVYAGKEIIYQ